MRVLIVEDEEKTADYLHRGLTEQGYTVDVAREGVEGLHLALVDDVCDSSRVLVTPVSLAEPLRAPRLALSYLCSRLGERLASGQLASLRDYDALQDADIDTFHLRGYLALPALARLNEALQADELQTALNDMLSNRPARA